VRADRGTSLRTVDAFVRRTAEKTDVAQIRTDDVRLQPLHDRCGIVDERVNERGIVEIFSALHRIFEKLFFRIFNAELLLLFRIRGVQTAGRTVRIAADDAHLFKDDNFCAAVRSFRCRRKTRASRAAAAAGAGARAPGCRGCRARMRRSPSTSVSS